MKNEFKDKTILITGGAGSIGSAIAVELMKYEPKTIRILDTHEFSLYKMQRAIESKDNNELMRYILGDVRDADRLKKATEGVDIIYHAAAYKHVPFCEYNPFEAIKTNVYGTQNIIEAAIYNKVKKVVLISTDKAAHPTGTLGASKLLAEKIITSANYYKGGMYPIFSSVRFGNVTMSSGSVIPNFIHQIKAGGPVTVTSPLMTRFFMSIKDATNLIFRATEMMLGGEVFVFKMKSVRIDDLARAIIDEYPYSNGISKRDIVIKYTKPRPGEKFHEQLLAEDECEKALETKDILILLPSIETDYKSLNLPNTLKSKTKKIHVNDYFSNKCLISKKEVRKFIRDNNITGSVKD